MLLLAKLGLWINKRWYYSKCYANALDNNVSEINQKTKKCSGSIIDLGRFSCNECPYYQEKIKTCCS